MSFEANKKLLCMELLSSSESSDDDEIFFCLKHLKAAGETKSKIKNYVTKVVYNYTDDQFKKHFRTSRGTCEKLISLFENSEFYPKYVKAGKELKSAEVHILSFLWFAGNKTVLRSVADRFDCSLSTVHTMFNRVMAFLLSIASTIIHFPNTENEKIECANAFQKIAGFPGIVGCIDGTYIPIRTPAHKIKSTYVNRHDTTSITLQGICDADKKFIDCFTGVPSKVHDARVLRLSFIWTKIQNLGPEFHLLGDAAYPLMNNLLTPYRDYGHLNNVEQNYNYKFAATRVKIENAFGLLKGRFRQLIRTDFHSVIRTSKFILCCCVLHNLCIENEDFLDEIYEEPRENPMDNINMYVDREVGIQKRNNIALELYNE